MGVDWGLRGGEGGGGGRDPALAMCRYLRGLSSLGCRDRKAAREQLEVSEIFVSFDEYLWALTLWNLISTFVLSLVCK